jgi:hypothetical protein
VGGAAGRFLSPDFNAMGDDLDPVPYADLNNPQSLNLYSYVQNNPLSHKDADGHKCDGGSVGPDGTFTFHCTNDPPPNPNGTVHQLAGALGLGFAPETGGASLGIAAGFAGAMLAAEYLAAHPIPLSSSNEPAPTTPGPLLQHLSRRGWWVRKMVRAARQAVATIADHSTQLTEARATQQGTSTH